MSLSGTNIFNRQIFILILLLLLSSSVLLAGTTTTLCFPDTVPANRYAGYRLNVTGVILIKKSPQKAHFRLQLINTGKEYISLGEAGIENLPVQVLFDTAFYKIADYVLENDFRKALLNKKVALQAGQMKSDMELTVPLSRPIYTPVGEDNYLSKGIEPSKTGNSKESPVVKTPPNEKNEIIFTPPLDEKNCGDLRIDTARVIERSRKWILVEFTISNRGNNPVTIAGTDKGDEDNVALKAYFSGTGKLTKGAVAAGGMFAKDTPKSRVNILQPLDTYTAAFRMDLTLKSKYTSNVVLYIDNYQLIRECDETNNTYSFFIY